MTDRPTKGIDALWDELWEDVRYNVTGRPSGPIRIARHQAAIEAAIEAAVRAALIDELVAAHSRIVNDFLSGKDHPDWTVLFDWHRDENDEEKTRAAFEAIVREATRDGTSGPRVISHWTREHDFQPIPGEMPFLKRCSMCGWGWKVDADNDFPCPGPQARRNG